MQTQLDTTLVVALVGAGGVIIGSLLSLIGNVANQWLTVRKDEKQWERQQKAEERRRDAEEQRRAREDQKAYKDNLRETYEECIRCLSLIASSNLLRIGDDENLQLFREAHDWLAKLILHLTNANSKEASELESVFQSFVRDPLHNAHSVRDVVIRLSRSDKELFPHAAVEIEDPREREFRIKIDQEYRQQQFQVGIELPRTHAFRCSIEELTPSQREKLWNAYYSGTVVPKSLELSLPHYDEKDKRFYRSGKVWNARLNPLICKTAEISNAWEADYDVALEEAEQAQPEESVQG